MEFYRGDTFAKSIIVKGYTFSPGDELKIGVKKSVSDTEYILYQEINLERAETEVQFIFPALDTKNIEPGKYVFEVELTYNGDKVLTVQKPLTVKGDAIRE